MEDARRRTLHGRRRGKKLRAGQQSLLDLDDLPGRSMPRSATISPRGRPAAGPVLPSPGKAGKRISDITPKLMSATTISNPRRFISSPRTGAWR